ncbi:hypothetical protein EMCRGX_G025012 [Ephydatia muelleri]
MLGLMRCAALAKKSARHNHKVELVHTEPQAEWMTSASVSVTTYEAWGGFSPGSGRRIIARTQYASLSIRAFNRREALS